MNRGFLTFILLAFCTLFTVEVSAEDEVATLANEKIIKEQLEYQVKFTSLMMRLGDQLHSDLDRASLPTNPAHPDFLKGDGVDEMLKKQISEYTKFFEQEVGLTTDETSKFRKVITDINYSRLKQAMRESIVGLGPFIKRNGRGVVTGLILGTALEFFTIGALWVTGLAHILPYAMIIPFRPLGIAIVTSGEQLSYKRRLIQLLGGIKSYRAYLKQRRVAAKKMRLGTAGQLLLPLNTAMNRGSETLDSLILSKDSWWHKTLTLFNIQPSTLTFSSVNLFLKNSNMTDVHINWIKFNPSLPNHIKTLLIVEHIVNTKDEETVIKFMTQFSRNFTKARSMPNWEATDGWVQRLMKAKDVPSIRSLMADPPQGIGAKQILTLWDDIILPHYSHSFTMSYDQYRAIKKEISLLRAFTEAKSINHWNEETFSKFDQKLIMSLNFNLPACRNPEARALKFLLSK